MTSFSNFCVGPTIVVDLGVIRIPLAVELYPNDVAPTHLKLANLPFEKAAPNLGSFTVGDLYVPVSNRHVTVSYASSPNDLLVDIDLDELGRCPGMLGAPTTGQFGLIALTGLLLVAALMKLRRRPAQHPTRP